MNNETQEEQKQEGFSKRTGYKMADRQVGYRGKKFEKKCFQRQLREKYESNEVIPLEDIEIKEIPFKEAQDFILKYEWLGTMGTTKFSIGIFCKNILCGVACFGLTAGTASLSEPFGEEYKNKGIVLVRGACASNAHQHCGSYLIGKCKKILEEKGYLFCIAYSDPEAGEIGTIYQATNWNFYGFTSKVNYLVRPDGKRVDPKIIHKYSKKHKISYSEQKELFLKEGYYFEKGNKKMKYLMYFGNKREVKQMLKHKKVKFYQYLKREHFETLDLIYETSLVEKNT